MKEPFFSLSVILPVYNEGENIADTVADTAKFLSEQSFLSAYEMIVVDDGSTDASRTILNSLGDQVRHLKVLHHPRNLGYGAALVSGIQQALSEWVLLMDADGQFKVDALLPMIPCLEHYDIVAGFRFKRTDSLYRIFLGQCYSRLAALLFKVNLKDINCGFKLFRKDIINIDAISSHGGVFYTDFFMKAIKQGCRVQQLPVEHFPRVRGKQTGASLKVVSAAVIDVIRLLWSGE
jgi:glycosyltransferase involved in cell wall biosynthesis